MQLRVQAGAIGWDACPTTRLLLRGARPLRRKHHKQFFILGASSPLLDDPIIEGGVADEDGGVGDGDCGSNDCDNDSESGAGAASR